MKHQNGFSLIELVVVTVLIGIIAVTAAPRFLNVQDDARASVYSSLAGSFRSSLALFHSKWLIDGEPNPDNPNGRVGDWGYTIYNLHFNKYGYPRIISSQKKQQNCADILKNLLPDSSLTSDDYEKTEPVSDGLDGNKCIYKFKTAPYTLTYSETNGVVTLTKDS